MVWTIVIGVIVGVLVALIHIAITNRKQNKKYIPKRRDIFKVLNGGPR